MIKKYFKVISLIIVVISICVLFYIDIKKCFAAPVSFVLLDDQDELLGAQIARDEQWRFPMIDTIPNKYKTAVLTFEDKRFYKHFGVDPLAVIRAIKLNLKSKKVISGASTITMQLMRMSRDDPKRNMFNKIYESYLAILFDLKYDKETLLRYYVSHAPFGGNVVGVEAAAWRYFGREIGELSWAESATLAVLPNSPSLIYPGKNQRLLKNKRDKLLQDLLSDQVIDSMQYRLSIAELLPQKPKPLPNAARHFLHRQKSKNKDSHTLQSHINFDLQNDLKEILSNHSQVNEQRGINSVAALIRDNRTGNIIAYEGNVSNEKKTRDNDMIATPRSSGSILKPILYAHMIDQGLLAPKQLVSDIPIHIEGFQPKNYNQDYRGLVPANEALAMSLNIPFVLMLRDFGVQRFLNRLQRLPFTTVSKGAHHYGLSLILGGAEVRLDELTLAYSTLVNDMQRNDKNDDLNPASIYNMIEAMYDLRRPDEHGNWESYSSAKKLAWKTGTSYGHRDAWAIGVTPQYTIGVWSGNADGTPNPEIIGSSLAGSVLFDIVNVLPNITEFTKPITKESYLSFCKKSGMKATEHCSDKHSIWANSKINETKKCTHHQKVYLNQDREYQVLKHCHSDAIDTSWFVISPRHAVHYKKIDPSYEALPPWHSDCINQTGQSPIEIAYPQANSKFAIPNNLKAEKEKIVCTVAHHFPDRKVYWHLDEQYLGMTTEFHKMPVYASSGIHKLKVIDDQGYSFERKFEVVK